MFGFLKGKGMAWIGLVGGIASVLADPQVVSVVGTNGQKVAQVVLYILTALGASVLAPKQQ